DLAEFRDDLFRLVLFLGHSFILHLARKPTSGRTTFQGAGQTRLIATRSKPLSAEAVAAAAAYAQEREFLDFQGRL
ncbi:hypothetical protein, partial [Paracoccus rhizosphaerae]|uniref:hypothetical protein n=1 Tax=Paracoccus rhizosphaerae TaxID=1133347 RepID=UPI00223ED22E